MANSLLDVNLLLALFHENHLHHKAANKWFAANQGSGWATCSVAEMGFIRIATNKSFTNPPIKMDDAFSKIAHMKTLPNYSFWPEPFNCLTNPDFADIFAKTTGSQYVTDCYLVAIAKFNKGRLASFDKDLCKLFPQYTTLLTA